MINIIDKALEKMSFLNDVSILSNDEFNFSDKGLTFAFKCAPDFDINSFDEEILHNLSFQLKISLCRKFLSEMSINSFRTMMYMPAKHNILSMLDDIINIMDSVGVSNDGRFLIIPPLLGSYLKKEDIDFKGVAENGMVGDYKCLSLYVSNYLTRNKSTTKLIAGHKLASKHKFYTAYSEVIYSEPMESNVCRGVEYYNFEIIRPEWLFTVPVIVG